MELSPIFLPENKTTQTYRKLRESYPTQWKLTFIEWFERQLLGRWDKAKISFAILSDWEKFWDMYDSAVATEALARHKAKHTGWNPKLAECHALARMLTKAKATRTMTESEQAGGSEQAPTWPQRWDTMTLDEAREEYAKSEFCRKLLRHNRPDLYTQIREEGAA